MTKSYWSYYGPNTTHACYKPNLQSVKVIGPMEGFGEGFIEVESVWGAPKDRYRFVALPDDLVPSHEHVPPEERRTIHNRLVRHTQLGTTPKHYLRHAQ